jgi:hypothetical protein
MMLKKLRKRCRALKSECRQRLVHELSYDECYTPNDCQLSFTAHVPPASFSLVVDGGGGR